MSTTIRLFFGKHVIQTNPSRFGERLFSDICLCRLCLKQEKKNAGFHVLSQGVPEGRSSEE